MSDFEISLPNGATTNSVANLSCNGHKIPYIDRTPYVEVVTFCANRMKKGDTLTIGAHKFSYEEIMSLKQLIEKGAVLLKNLLSLPSRGKTATDKDTDPVLMETKIPENVAWHRSQSLQVHTFSFVYSQDQEGLLIIIGSLASLIDPTRMIVYHSQDGGLTWIEEDSQQMLQSYPQYKRMIQAYRNKLQISEGDPK